MQALKCPACDVREGVYEGFMFEDCGVWSDGRTPIRRCRNCAAGFLAKPRRVVGGFRVSRIDDATWGKIQGLLDRERELRRPPEAEPPTEEQIRAHVRALERGGHRGETLVHIVAEWLGVDSDRGRAAVKQALDTSAR